MALRHYETVMIVNPVLSEEQYNTLISTWKIFFKEHQVIIDWQENLGLRKLAYPIKNKHTGFYYVVAFQAEPKFIHILEQAYGRDENLMRFLTTAFDRHAIAYHQQRRKAEAMAAIEAKASPVQPQA